MNDEIKFLTKKMSELEEVASKIDNKKNYDEYLDLVTKITFLDEIIDEMKKELEKKED